MAQPRVALVNHWLVSPGGAERVVVELHKLWPEAPIYTAAYSPKKFPELAGADVRTTWLDKVPLAKRKHQFFPILRALAFKSLDLSEYDIVITSDAAEAKMVKTGENTLHICYCHTPIRYLWVDYEWYMKHPPFGWLNPLARVVLKFTLGWLKSMDYDGAQRVNWFVANSHNVAQRIRKYYGRDSQVIYPPIDTERFKLSRKHGDYYLIVGRQVAYKRLDLAVDAFNELGLDLRVAGVGEEAAKQAARSKPNIEFLGRVSDEKLVELYAGAKGFIFPTEEDFGMVPVEAMASGTPVIAYASGGALEYVIEGETGVLFKDQTAVGLKEAIERFEKMKFSPERVRAEAEKFAATVFDKAILDLVSEKWRDFRAVKRSGRGRG
jgi:glycosyltransferase involved in cell wall biosynthesis